MRQVFQHLDMTGDGTIQVDDLRLRSPGLETLPDPSTTG